MSMILSRHSAEAEAKRNAEKEAKKQVVEPVKERPVRTRKTSKKAE